MIKFVNDFRQFVYLRFPEKQQNTNFIAFGLIRQVLEPTIYRTRGEHANHYTTDAVLIN
jgi:hypothetical protein